MILLLGEPATPDQIALMLTDWEVMIKVVGDIRRKVLAGGGEMHADGEALLLADGSQLADLWGANWYPGSLDSHPSRDGRSAMKDFVSVKTRYLRDPIAVRLGGLAADLARVGSTAANPTNGCVVQVLLEEARRFIEWTAADLQEDVAAELVDLQLSLTLWLNAWEHASTHGSARALLAHQAASWSDRVLGISGLTG
jgi:hypothetical protein